MQTLHRFANFYITGETAFFGAVCNSSVAQASHGKYHVAAAPPFSDLLSLIGI